MNKRILDGAGLWKSDKLARVQPEWMRAEYANWIPLALANGVFEADTRRIWALSTPTTTPIFRLMIPKKLGANCVGRGCSSYGPIRKRERSGAISPGLRKLVGFHPEAGSPRSMSP